MSVTLELARRVEQIKFACLPDTVVMATTQCLLDWVGVAMGARAEPLVDILHATMEEEGGHEQATVIGRSRRLTATQAALVNGAMGHALDYDDVNKAGHPSAPVAPVVLALGERFDLTGRDMIEAFVAGYEIETRVADFMGPSHYERGWHTTATFGTFGASAAAAKLLKLDVPRICHAFGIAGTQAAGLKSVFGTMCKPFHAGRAARTGMEAALLAARDFSSNVSILEARQGFGYTQSDATDTGAALSDPQGGYHILQNLYKYHAACYLTHSSIEALLRLRAQSRFDPVDVARVKLEVAPIHMDVCNIAVPVTGLECKFSIRMIAALAISGEDTSREDLYSDATVRREDLAQLRERIMVEPSLTGTLARVTLDLKDGRSLTAQHDVGVPETDLDRQQRKLERKFRRIVPLDRNPEALIELVKALPHTQSVHSLMAALRS